MSPTTLRALRLALASLLVTALVAQLAIGLSRSDLSVVRFFSFFTVLSNTSAVVMLTLLALRPRRDDSAGFVVFRGAVTVYMSVTGLVYALILYPTLADVAVPEPWIDWSIHVIGPLALVLDWLFNTPKAGLGWNAIGWWLIFPAVYLVYSLVRGPIVDWYPYPFLDPDEQGGYDSVALWSVVVLVVIVGLSAFYRWWANRKPTTAVPA